MIHSGTTGKTDFTEVASGPRSRVPGSPEHGLMHLSTALVLAWLVVGVLLPLVPILQHSLADRHGQFVGVANYVKYFSSPALSNSFGNSLCVAGLTTLLSLTLGLAFAYALTRTTMRGKTFFRWIAMLPLYAPSMAHAIGLVYLFGKKGVVTSGGLGLAQRALGIPLGLDIQLYGLTGIVLGELLWCLPQAVLILATALSLADARLYEASQALGGSSLRTFLTVTIPGIKYGLMSAAFVCFTLSFTDFGVPKVVGGNFNVLATDIYKQVIGQQNFAMGATISMLLLVPSVLAFFFDRLVQRHQAAVVGAGVVPLRPKRNPLADGLATIFCTLAAAAILAVLGAVMLASVVDVWPYRLALSLRHFDFSTVGGGGMGAFWNSLRMAVYSAVVGTVVVFGAAYLVEKGRSWKPARIAIQFLSMIPVALPGMVIGLAYVFFFNPRQFHIIGLSVPNPFSGLYGTMAILVLANVIHFFTVGYLTAATALKQLDADFEAVSASMAVPFYRTFWRVTVPLCLPAILEIGAYFFVNALVTVSAVVFLYSPQLKLASVAIVNMDDAGDTAAAAAMSVLVILAGAGVRFLFGLATRRIERRSQAWRVR